MSVPAQRPSVRPRSSVSANSVASALTAGVGDFKQFKSGHQFGAWLGMVPRQDSSGGKTRLGRITSAATTTYARC